MGIDTAADIATTRLSEMILNDIPTTDPRWNKTNTSGNAVQHIYIVNRHVRLLKFLLERVLIFNYFFVADSLGSYSLIILNQLQDKQKAHKKLIQFLIDMELLDLVSSSHLITAHTHTLQLHLKSENES